MKGDPTCSRCRQSIADPSRRYKLSLSGGRDNTDLAVLICTECRKAFLKWALSAPSKAMP